MTEEEARTPPDEMRYRVALREALAALTCRGDWQGCAHSRKPWHEHQAAHVEEAVALIKRALRDKK